MRILWVKADKLLPVQNGGHVRAYRVLRHLSERHELTFRSYMRFVVLSGTVYRTIHR